MIVANRPGRGGYDLTGFIAESGQISAQGVALTAVEQQLLAQLAK